MAAQFGGMIKRIQHGFSTWNGLMGALLARGGYEGIKKAFEQPFGGFLAMFSLGNGRNPPYREDAIVYKLGTQWETMHLRNKLYAAVGTAHGMIEVLENMQATHPERFASDQLGKITKIHAAQNNAPAFITMSGGQNLVRWRLLAPKCALHIPWQRSW